MEICGVKITNPDKVVFSAASVTKGEVLRYYKDVSRLMLKTLKNRPVSVFRCHGGVEGDCFFKKHPSTEGKDIAKILLDGEQYFYISSAKDLVFQAQNGTIEFHAWGCKYPKLENPNLMVFDLDPDEKLPLSRLREGTIKVKEVLDELGLKSTLKTSGGKGYHIMVEFKKGVGWDEFGKLAEDIAKVVEAKNSDLFTTNIRKNQRGGKIFIDYLRNKRGASCVAAYSLRARAGATISMPIGWDELDKVAPSEVNIRNYRDYIKP